MAEGDKRGARYRHRNWTTALGLAFIGGVFCQLIRTRTNDTITSVVVGVVAYLWCAYQLRSVQWERQAVAPEVTPPPARLVRTADGDRLPAGESDILAESALAGGRAPAWLGTGATALISIGLAGTFLGLTLGLFEAIPLLKSDTEGAIGAMLAGAKLAFVKSLAGIVLATLWTFRLIGVREHEEALRREVVEALDQRYPPVSPEHLLTQTLERQAAQSERIATALGVLSRQLEATNATAAKRLDASTVQHKALLAALQQIRGADGASLSSLYGQLVTMETGAATQRAASTSQHEALLVAIGAIQSGDEASIAALSRQTAAVEASAAKHREASAVQHKALIAVLRQIQGTEDASLAALGETIGELKATIQDLGEQLPAQIGIQTGQSVGTLLQPRLEDLSQALQVLGTTGREAISEAMQANVGSEVGELRHALVALSAVLVKLPELVTQGGQEAVAGLHAASSNGAQRLTDATQGMAAQTGEIRTSIQELGNTLEAIRGLVTALQGGGDRLRDAFQGVAQPLEVLPTALHSAREGVEAAGRAASEAAGQLSAAGADAAGHLTRGASTAALTLEQAGAAAGSSLKGAAGEAGVSLRAGGQDLASQAAEAGKVLQDGVATELIMVRDALHAEVDAQREFADTWREEREAMLHGAQQARAQFDKLEEGGQALIGAVGDLRAACDSTVQALASVSGDQRQGAAEAVQQLLTAVQEFSAALAESRQAVQDASFQTVASTEQVTAKAAREVAEALTKGAEGLAGAMSRAEEMGGRIQAQAEALVRNVTAAQQAAAAMEGHGATLVTSGASLRKELQGLTDPLSQARLSLDQVPPAVKAATSALEMEHRALVGLGESLKGQANLVRTQEESLTKRTSELHGLHKVLGEQWTGHVDRMAQAHEKVRTAWQQAMLAADQGLDKNAEQIGRYAERVEQALGLKAEVIGLQEGLQSLADSLGKEGLGSTLGTLDKRLSTLQTLPKTLDTLTREVVRLQDAVDGIAGVDATGHETGVSP